MKVTKSICLEEEMIEKLEIRAKEEERSASQVISIALKKYLENN